MLSVLAFGQTVVMDKDEDFPVSYASVFDQDGKFLGQTDVDGLLPDIKDSKSILVTHIAYEQLKVKADRIGKVLKMKAVPMKINDAVIAKPRAHCIRLTGFLRNYTLTNQLFEQDDPVSRFYEGTGQMYIFLNSNKSSKWCDLAVRNSQKGEMVKERKGHHMNLTSKSIVESIRNSEKISTRQTDGYTQIIKNDTTVGTIVPDSANNIARINIDYLFPDTVRTINIVIMKLRVTEAKQNFVYSIPEDDYFSQTNLLACNNYIHFWTKMFGKRIEANSFSEFYVDKAELLTEDEYKEEIKRYKNEKKQGVYDMTSEQLDEYIASHHIQEIPEELQKKLEISKEIQAQNQR
jgi:hypothetical protein